MDGENGAARRKISNLAATFMIGIALIIDGLQFLFTLTVFGTPFSWLLTFFAICIFGVWNAILGVNYFSGRKSGLKTLSVIASSVAELVPIVDAIPGVTAGIIGVIVGTRLEERQEKKAAAKNTSAANAVASNHVRFSGPQKIPLAAANDEEEQEYREAA